MSRSVPLLLCALLLSACGADEAETATTSGDESESRVYPPLRIVDAHPGPYVRTVRGGCTSGPDSCESRGDCEALPVDCGPADERMRISAIWSSSDDLDLYVSDRAGDTLSFLRPNGFSGGMRIVPPGRSCLPQTQTGSEVAAYTGPNVLTGVYTITLEHFGSCMSGLGTVDVDVTVSAGGRHLASYRATLAPHDRIEILSMDTAE